MTENPKLSLAPQTALIIEPLSKLECIKSYTLVGGTALSLKAKVSLSEMIESALQYSQHRFKSKNLLAKLTKSDRFIEDSNFKTLHPIYDITSIDIENTIKELLKH